MMHTIYFQMFRKKKNMCLHTRKDMGQNTNDRWIWVKKNYAFFIIFVTFIEQIIILFFPTIKKKVKSLTHWHHPTEGSLPLESLWLWFPLMSPPPLPPISVQKPAQFCRGIKLKFLIALYFIPDKSWKENEINTSLFKKLFIKCCNKNMFTTCRFQI